MSIYLTALIKSKAGAAAEMKSLLLKLVEASKKEEACLQYELYHSVEDENLFIFHETWASEEGIAEHGKGEGITNFIRDSADVIDGPIVIHTAERVI